MLSQPHFLNVEHLRHVDASRRIKRSERRCLHCADKAEDERHALMQCPVFDLERGKWRRRLQDYGVECIDEDELFKLGIDHSGRSKVVFYTTVFVRGVLKMVRQWCIRP
jgi:hypothetical protein